MKINRQLSSLIPKTEIWKPPLIRQLNLSGEIEYLPVYMNKDIKTTPPIVHPDKNLSTLSQNKKSFLGCNLVPREWRVEGREELPCVLPYTGVLPRDLVGIDERVPKNNPMPFNCKL